MSNLPSELKYSKTHEWIRTEDDGTATVGITHYAQELLGDLVFVELPEVGRQVSMGSECAVVESVKAASDIYSPVTGEIIAINEALTESPEIINESPFEGGWIFKLRLEKPDELNGLLSPDAYAQVMAEDEH